MGITAIMRLILEWFRIIVWMFVYGVLMYIIVMSLAHGPSHILQQLREIVPLLQQLI